MAAEIIPASEPTPYDAGRDDGVALGQWYWVQHKVRWDGEIDGMKKGQIHEWLGCVTHVGSNFARISQPTDGQSSSAVRVHFDRLATKLRREREPEATIRRLAEESRQRTESLMAEVRAITARLGVRSGMIGGPAESAGRAIAVLSGVDDVKAYGKALALAKEKTLPALFEEMKSEGRELKRWLMAVALPMRAEMKRMESSLDDIEDRIFNVTLYAGLTEDVEKIADGAPGAITDKLHIMQRRLYMDEECLLNYQAGGMEFKQIGEFDRWIARPENRDRILPFPRTVVAMKVRRHKKERERTDHMIDAYINFHLEQADKTTFLYIRNGSQVWRLSCDEDFGETLFPEAQLNGEGDVMMKTDWDKIEAFMPRSEFEVRSAEHEETVRLYKAWKAANPKKHDFDNPHRDNGDRFNPDKWEPFDPRSVYFDDATAKVTAQIKAFNRIVYILQGLLDRSETLHPHPPINLANSEHLARHVELVRDAGATLAAGAKPDFEAYRARLNALATDDSSFTGQREQWLLAEGRKITEENRRRAGWSGRVLTYKRYEPHGNPGPAVVCKPARWSRRLEQATFEWKRERLREPRWPSRSASNSRDDGVACRIIVKGAELLNVSAYKAGDYLQFFQDHRTREEYLKWAPLMLAAEDFLAQKKNTIKTGYY